MLAFESSESTAYFVLSWKNAHYEKVNNLCVKNKGLAPTTGGQLITLGMLRWLEKESVEPLALLSSQERQNLSWKGGREKLVLLGTSHISLGRPISCFKVLLNFPVFLSWVYVCAVLLSYTSQKKMVTISALPDGKWFLNSIYILQTFGCLDLSAQNARGFTQMCLGCYSFQQSVRQNSAPFNDVLRGIFPCQPKRVISVWVDLLFCQLKCKLYPLLQNVLVENILLLDRRWLHHTDPWTRNVSVTEMLTET